MPALTPTTQDTFYGPSIHQSYDVYRHSVRDPGGNPVIIYRHGGGWAGNDKRDIGVDANAPNRLAAYLLARTAPTDTHFDIISVESRQRSFSSSGAAFGYDQPSEMPSYFPEAWDDVKLAIVHIKQNAASLGIDPKKVVLWGNSAGATTLWWSQLTAPLVVNGVDSRALAMMFEKPLVDFRRDGAGVETYSSETDNFYDYVFGTDFGLNQYPGADLSTATRNAASIAWYYETNQLTYAIPAMVLAGPQQNSISARTNGPNEIVPITAGRFSEFVTTDKVQVTAGQAVFSVANLAPGYIAANSKDGVYALSLPPASNLLTITPTNGRARITGTGFTISQDGMQLKAGAFASYAHKDGDLFWIEQNHGGSTEVVVSRPPPTASVAGSAGAYRITGKVVSDATGETIAIDRSCLRGSPTGAQTGSGYIYPVDFCGISGGSVNTFARMSVKRVTAKPYVDPHDPQQYASMESLVAQQQDTALLSFVPFFQYDGDKTAAFKDYRHSSAMYDFAASAVKGRPTALSSTLVGAQVG